MSSLTPRWDSPLFDHYRSLVAKVDEHAARVVAQYTTDIACTAGCTACCRQDLTVCTVERDYISAFVSSHDIEPADGALTPTDDHPLFTLLAGSGPCVFLAHGGVCAIYEARPLICRTHGLPILVDGKLDSCGLNFRVAPDDRFAHIAPAHKLDLETLNTTFAVIERIFADATGQEPTRMLLSELRRTF